MIIDITVESTGLSINLLNMLFDFDNCRNWDLWDLCDYCLNRDLLDYWDYQEMDKHFLSSNPLNHKNPGSDKEKIQVQTIV